MSEVECDHAIGLDDCECFDCYSKCIVLASEVTKLTDLEPFNYCPYCGEKL